MPDKITSLLKPQSTKPAAVNDKPKRFRRHYCREGCGNAVEEKDDLCPGCDAYREHTGYF